MDHHFWLHNKPIKSLPLLACFSFLKCPWALSKYTSSILWVCLSFFHFGAFHNLSRSDFLSLHWTTRRCLPEEAKLYVGPNNWVISNVIDGNNKEPLLRVMRKQSKIKHVSMDLLKKNGYLQGKLKKQTCLLSSIQINYNPTHSNITKIFPTWLLFKYLPYSSYFNSPYKNIWLIKNIFAMEANIIWIF